MKAFTLLEVLIALIVLTLGVVALCWVFNAGIFASTDAENVDLALNIAQAKLEEIKDAGYDSLVGIGPTTDPNFSNFYVTVAVGPPADPRQVDVTVEWKAPSGIKKGQVPSAGITLTTLISDY